MWRSTAESVSAWSVDDARRRRACCDSFEILQPRRSPTPALAHSRANLRSLPLPRFHGPRNTHPPMAQPTAQRPRGVPVEGAVVAAAAVAAAVVDVDEDRRCMRR